MTAQRKTHIGIRGEDFTINGELTYKGRHWRNMRIEGLLINQRWVQAIFDDRNAETRRQWNYPDGPWDAERNVREFLEHLPAWRAAGVLSFDVNFQGGSPRGYTRGKQPWHNSAFEADGTLRDDYADRMRRVLDAADELGMAPMVGFFYFGQDERLTDEAAVLRAADQATDWLLGQGYRHVLIEIANEINVSKYEHAILTPERCPELIERVRERCCGRFPVGISMGGGKVPPDPIIAASDYIMLHGNGVKDPNRIREMVDQTRASRTYRGQPVVFNEDDHFDFDQDDNNFIAALSRHASWGMFDWRMEGEDYHHGFQSVPVDWRPEASQRKRDFVKLCAEITGGKVPAAVAEQLT